jgi:hypothetical protein
LSDPPHAGQVAFPSPPQEEHRSRAVRSLGFDRSPEPPHEEHGTFPKKQFVQAIVPAVHRVQGNCPTPWQSAQESSWQDSHRPPAEQPASPAPTSRATLSVLSMASREV